MRPAAHYQSIVWTFKWRLVAFRALCVLPSRTSTTHAQLISHSVCANSGSGSVLTAVLTAAATPASCWSCELGLTTSGPSPLQAFDFPRRFFPPLPDPLIPPPPDSFAFSVSSSTPAEDSPSSMRGARSSAFLRKILTGPTTRAGRDRCGPAMSTAESGTGAVTARAGSGFPRQHDPQPYTTPAQMSSRPRPSST